MSTKPELDPELHEGDTVTSVWRRRLVLALLILLVVAIAAPTFGGCSGFLPKSEVVATYVVGGETHEVSDEALGRFMVRYSSAMQFLNEGGGLPDGEEGEKEALRLLVLDDVAAAEGIHVSDDDLAAQIHARPHFQLAGTFDEGTYRSYLANFSRAGLTHKIVTDMLRTELRVREYTGLRHAAFQLVPGDAIYDAWKKRSVKLTVDYVASPYAAQRAKSDALEPTDEDLAKIASLPAVRAILAVPPRKVVEVAYLKVESMTPAEVEAATKFVEEAELLEANRTLRDEAFMTFHADRDFVFTKARWSALSDPEFPSKLAQWEKDHKAWETAPPETRGEEPKRPTDPAESYPQSEADQFVLWRERAEKETLARLVVQHLGERAAREGKPFRDLLPDYEKLGVRVVRNEEPLTDAEIVEKYPDPVARDSEFGQVVSVVFKAPDTEGVFKPQYHVKPVPTTQLAEKIQDRGFMVLRLDASDPARQYQVTERREPVIAFWRNHVIAESAKQLAEDVRKKTEAAGADVAKAREAMRAAATEAGLTVETLRRFNRTTEAPRPPQTAPGETLAPELAALAQKLEVRNRVQQDYQVLSGLEPGKMRDPNLVDDKAGLAIAVLLVEKHEPSPTEMRDDDVQQEKFGIAFQAKNRADAVFSYEALAKRYQIVRRDAAAPKKAP